MGNSEKNQSTTLVTPGGNIILKLIEDVEGAAHRHSDEKCISIAKKLWDKILPAPDFKVLEAKFIEECSLSSQANAGGAFTYLAAGWTGPHKPGTGPDNSQKKTYYYNEQKKRSSFTRPNVMRTLAQPVGEGKARRLAHNAAPA